MKTYRYRDAALVCSALFSLLAFALIASAIINRIFP